MCVCVSAPPKASAEAGRPESGEGHVRAGDGFLFPAMCRFQNAPDNRRAKRDSIGAMVLDWGNYTQIFQNPLILTLRDPPRPGPAHPREHGDSAAPKSLDPQQEGLGLGFRVPGSWFMVWGLGLRVSLGLRA